MMTADQILSNRYIAVSPACSVGDAVRLMLSDDAIQIFVVDENEVVLGLLTDSTILRSAVDPHLQKDPVSLHAVRKFAAVKPGIPVEALIDLFVLHNLMTIPVLDNQRICGIVERTDLLKNCPALIQSPPGMREAAFPWL